MRVSALLDRFLARSGLVIISMALAASCSTGTPAPAPAGNNGQTVVPSSAPLALGEADSGKQITLDVGQMLQVRLKATPTAGYLWQVRQQPAQLRLSAEASEPENAQLRAKGMVGGNDWAIFTFVATSVGNGNLTLDYGRPWERVDGKAFDRVWQIEVNVQPGGSTRKP